MTEPIERHFTATAYIVSQGRTLLLWHRKLGMWLPPGGHCEPNEDPVQAARREAEEESGLAVEIIAPRDLLVCVGPLVLPPPVVILVEDIVRADQPFHQHIDNVYFARPLVELVDFAAPIPAGMHRWLSTGELATPFALATPDGTLAPVADDVRLLGVRAIAAAADSEIARA